MPIVLVVYRGEHEYKKDISLEARLKDGLIPYKEREKSLVEIYNEIRSEIKLAGGSTIEGKINQYSQNLIGEGKPGNLATAWKLSGAYQYHYFYTIEIANIYFFKWSLGTNEVIKGDRLELNGPDDAKKPFMVLNAETVDASTIFAFGHIRDTKEITFFHGLPIECIRSVSVGKVETIEREALITKVKSYTSDNMDATIIANSWYGKRRKWQL
jgi:hypothetical protein